MIKNKITNFLCLSLLLLGATVMGMNNPEEQLRNAAESGNLEEVERLIALGAAIEAKDNEGRTPLRYAASNGHEAVCRLLIEKNAIVEAKDNSGRTSLMRAAQYGHEAVCRLLIANKAAIETKCNDDGGWTPLLYASHRGHEDVCRLLIENKAAIDEQDYYGSSALKFATTWEHEGVYSLLIVAHLERAKKDRANIVQFLGIAKKRKQNFPREITNDVAKIIARQAFETVQQDKRSVIEQINRIDNLRKRAEWLAYIKQQMNSPMK